MGKYFKENSTLRHLVHHNLEHQIYDEDYTEVKSSFFGLFKSKENIHVTHDISNIKNKVKTNGFLKNE